MKLIIDMPEEKYRWIKTHNLNIDNNSIVGAIVNGTPVSTDGDLISRQALKKDIDFQYICKCCHNVNGNVCDICHISEIEKKIDNAPTVEYTFEEAFQKTICEQRLYCPERQQGKWINREAVSNTTFPFWERYECNQCHKFNGYSNFCPNCGADMRKGDKV